MLGFMRHPVDNFSCAVYLLYPSRTPAVSHVQSPIDLLSNVGRKCQLQRDDDDEENCIVVIDCLGRQAASEDVVCLLSAHTQQTGARCSLASRSVCSVQH